MRLMTLWLFPDPVRTAQTDTTGTLEASMVASAPRIR